MDYIIDSAALEFIVAALRQTPQSSNVFRAESLFRRIMEKGWAFKSDLEDIIYYLDARLGPYQMDVIKFSALFEIHWEQVYFRPRASSNSVSQFDAIRVEDIALFLMIMERIGFQTDPSILVNLLLPGIKSIKKKVVNDSELEIFWFKKTQHKYEEINLKIEEDTQHYTIIDKFKTPLKYSILVKGKELGKAEVITISAPKFRKHREIVQTTCAQCGLQWCKGDPDSNFIHRREHKLRMEYLEPKPSQEMLEEFQTSEHPELVTSQSPRWKQKAMYSRALAFRRELNYDFVQWSHPKSASDLNAHGVLFSDNSGRIVGACSFRNDRAENNNNSWKLDWIWICPKERRKGHLAVRWKALRDRFGDFLITFPVSLEMKAFLDKHGDSALTEL